MFRISKQTVINRDRGLNKSHKEAGKTITRLTMIEEEVIADMALDLYKAGWPLTLTMVREYGLRDLTSTRRQSPPFPTWEKLACRLLSTPQECQKSLLSNARTRTLQSRFFRDIPSPF